LIAQAERPVILAGHGIKSARSERLFRECIAQLGIPVLTTWRASDLVGDDHPLFFGRPGAIGQPGANLVVQDADLLVSIGARLDFAVTGFDQSQFARAAKKVVVDVDEAEIRKLKTKVNVPVTADAGDFIREMLARKTSIRHNDREIILKKAYLEYMRENEDYMQSIYQKITMANPVYFDKLRSSERGFIIFSRFIFSKYIFDKNNLKQSRDL
jgi:thiamine pyrophosphate-dependent acetolactate synthase large subunit-like protein